MTRSMWIPLLGLVALAACKDDGPSPDDSTVPESPVDDSGPVEDGDGDGYTGEEDCDDADPTVNAGAAEVCDDRDNNCDGAVDENLATAWYTDADGDGYGDPATETLACAQPEGTSAQAGDCDDSDPAYNPGAAEADCGDPNDYNCDGSVGYADADNDGFAACQECDDGDAAVNPASEEVCDNVDNNCDGAVDEGVTSTWYADNDGDGAGDADYSVQACTQPEGYAASADDCDDADAAVNPSATEICDNLDNNCDSLVDDADPSLDSGTAASWYSDADGDGYGEASSATLACTQPSGAVSDSTDCDDSDASVNPAATEICDNLDNDCDGVTDPATASGASTWYSDADGDGYGDASTAQLACDSPSGAVSDSTDCDDSTAAVNPGATELCDSLDNDCDGVTDPNTSSDAATWYADSDGDGYGDKSVTTRACSRPSGYRANTKDCDDSDATTYTGATELCDSVDNDCDGTVDDGVLGTGSACPATTCLDVLTADPSATSGVYSLEPVSGTAFDAYCDMSTDGGGWTLAFIKNSADYDSYADAGGSYEDLTALQTDPATASSSSTGVSGWLNINEFTYTALRLAAYRSGVQTYMSNDIDPAELNIDFGQDGYLLYNDSNGYYWCVGAASYTDSGSGQVNRPSGAPADCKGHGSLGSGWDFSTSASTNQGLTMCGVDAGSRWMYGAYGTSLYTYPAAGAAQAIWLR